MTWPCGFLLLAFWMFFFFFFTRSSISWLPFLKEIFSKTIYEFKFERSCFPFRDPIIISSSLNLLVNSLWMILAKHLLAPNCQTRLQKSISNLNPYCPFFYYNDSNKIYCSFVVDTLEWHSLNIVHTDHLQKINSMVGAKC